MTNKTREEAITDLCNKHYPGYGRSEHYTGSEECAHLFSNIPEFKRVAIRKEMTWLYEGLEELNEFFKDIKPR